MKAAKSALFLFFSVLIISGASAASDSSELEFNLELDTEIIQDIQEKTSDLFDQIKEAIPDKIPTEPTQQVKDRVNEVLG